MFSSIARLQRRPSHWTPAPLCAHHWLPSNAERCHIGLRRVGCVARHTAIAPAERYQRSNVLIGFERVYYTETTPLVRSHFLLLLITRGNVARQLMSAGKHRHPIPIHKITTSITANHRVDNCQPRSSRITVTNVLVLTAHSHTTSPSTICQVFIGAPTPFPHIRIRTSANTILSNAEMMRMFLPFLHQILTQQ